MNPLQRAAFRRKVIYLAVILGLFTLSMFWRGMLPIPLSGLARAGEPASFADRIAANTILHKAVALELREVDEGEQDLEGSTARLALIGSRGFVVTYLWQSAIQSQRRNDFHKMEKRIETVMQLQPHFITPWIFQSWNITYNVSVEMQGSGDMYYYIARGIELLAEGERRQGRIDPESGRRLGSPDMRYQIAFYYQMKFGVTDNVETLRCLFQLSCIPPNERDPATLTNADGSVNLPKFQEFCTKYPHLVRRLRGENLRAAGYDAATRRRIDGALKCPLPVDVIQFLRENKDVPSRYKSGQELADADRQFPSLPPKFAEGKDEASPASSPENTGDDFSGFKASRAWYTFSMVPLPPEPVDANDKPLPAPTPQPGEYDPAKYRIPRQPMLIIFRQGAPRCQSSHAEMEQKEGWFDDEGWRIDSPLDPPSTWWFPDATGRNPLPVVVGRDKAWSVEAWGRAAQMWTAHGEAYGLILSPERIQAYREAAKQLGTFTDPTPAQLEDPAYRIAYHTAMAMYFYDQNRQVTNFPYFLAAANAEKQPATVAARKTLWQAEQARKLGNKTGPRGAIALYEQGLRMWRDVLIANRDFHRTERSEHTDEETYAYELYYLRLLVLDDERVGKKADAIVAEANAGFAILPFPFSRSSLMSVRDVQEEAKWAVVETDPTFSPFVGIMDVNDDRKGGPWIQNFVKESVRAQQGVQRRKTPPPEAVAGPPGMPRPTPGSTPP